MCSRTVVVTRVRAQHMTQMTLAEHDHMIKALASNRTDHSFGIAVLPWRSSRCRSVANAHRADAPRKDLAVDPVPVTDEVLRLADQLPNFERHLRTHELPDILDGVE